ncbi:hypothetical protein EYF80_024590 [Liparis tanakae]|uniref:Uncharacterized protein n=1 Tax=Liparis tanakae TaxID=230148 RepID=A0A4Z2HJS5_9TELE|nr:hypothetical protein EYF80_024590 [Liparis tanakae]
MVALVQTQVLMAIPVPNIENRLIFSTIRLGRFLMMHSGIGLLVCEAIVTLASHLSKKTSREIKSQRLDRASAHVAEFTRVQQQTDRKDLQHVFSEAPLPFRLVEEVVEVAAEESGLIRCGSAPRIGAVPGVVVLELDLVFDLVDQNLRQEDANQLQEESTQAEGSPAELCPVQPVTSSLGWTQQEKGTEQRSLLGLSCSQAKYMFWDQSVYVTPPQQPN